MQCLEEQSVSCPYCGEMFSTQVDCSAGDQQYTEDCQVCCRPILFNLQIGINGFELHVKREDDT